MSVLLEVENLSVGFSKGKSSIAITDQTCFEVKAGEVFGLVGESGCGKTVTALSVLGLLPEPGGKVLSGEIRFEGKNILDFSQRELESYRGGQVSMIFQEPSAALNPLLRIGKQLKEVYSYHPTQGNADQEIQELLHRVGLSDLERILTAYPHELSGGMLQRVMIAMALLTKPKLIIADEPTTALDVTVQAQIMELLMELKDEFGMGIILITHNLALVAQYADRVGVMYAGRIVEKGEVKDFIENPRHPYSKALIAAIPRIDKHRRLSPIPGQVPQPEDYIHACRFKERCSEASERCNEKPPEIGDSQKSVSCFLYQKDS